MSASYSEILNGLGYSLKDYGNHYRTAALFRDGTNQMSLCIRKSDGAFIDFGGKKQRGSFEKLLKLIIGDKPEEIKKYLSEIEVSAATYAPKQEIKQRKVYPKEVLLGLLPHWDYFLEQGISIETLKLFEVGLDQKGKLARRYCFPVYEDGDIIGFIGRWHQRTHPSWNDPTHPYQVPKYKKLGDGRVWLWPLHLNKEIIENAEEVILVESPNCVLHLWEAGVKNVLCLMSTDLSPKMLKYLLSLTKLKRIIIATNNEPDNPDKFSPEGIGNAAAKDIEKKLLRWFDRERVVVKLPTKKDFGEMSTDEILAWKNDLTTESNEIIL